MATIKNYQGMIAGGMNGAIQDSKPDGLAITSTDDVMHFSIQATVITDGVKSTRRLHFLFATTDVAPGSDATYDAFDTGTIMFAPAKIYRKDTGANVGTNTWTSAALS